VNALPVYNNDPLTYCIGDNASQRFNHGSHAATYGQNSKACQVYMANRCAQNWDGVCEYAASKPANEEYKYHYIILSNILYLV
jgi:acetylornithine/succinyldiaminopimelate/putrescine aminotransferase